MDKIYEMNLGDILTPKGNLDYLIIRVPGGWIYRFSQINQTVQVDGTWSENYFCDSVFVPFNNEFQERIEKSI
jgi:hypothetical protein